MAIAYEADQVAQLLDYELELDTELKRSLETNFQISMRASEHAESAEYFLNRLVLMDTDEIGTTSVLDERNLALLTRLYLSLGVDFSQEHTEDHGDGDEHRQERRFFHSSEGITFVEIEQSMPMVRQSYSFGSTSGTEDDGSSRIGIRVRSLMDDVLGEPEAPILLGVEQPEARPVTPEEPYIFRRFEVYVMPTAQVRDFSNGGTDSPHADQGSIAA